MGALTPAVDRLLVLLGRLRRRVQTETDPCSWKLLQEHEVQTRNLLPVPSQSFQNQTRKTPSERGGVSRLQEVLVGGATKQKEELRWRTDAEHQAAKSKRQGGCRAAPRRHAGSCLGGEGREGALGG